MQAIHRGFRRYGATQKKFKYRLTDQRHSYNPLIRFAGGGSIKLDTVKSGWSIIYIEGSQVIVLSLKIEQRAPLCSIYSSGFSLFDKVPIYGFSGLQKAIHFTQKIIALIGR